MYTAALLVLTSTAPAAMGADPVPLSALIGRAPVAQTPDARARAALALAAPLPPVAPPVRESFRESYTAAVKDSKPLVVWIGYKCPSSAAQVPGMLHWFAPGESWQTTVDGKARTVAGPAVVVLVPGGDGHLYRGEVIGAADCCATSIRAAVERTLAGWERDATAARMRSQLQAAPAAGMGFMSHVRGWASSRNGQCAG